MVERRKFAKDYSLLIKEFDIPCCFLDKEGRFLYFNSACKKLFGVSTLKNKNLKEFISPSFSDSLREWTEGKAIICEGEISVKGKKKFVRLLPSLKYDKKNNYIGALVIFEDLGEKKIEELKEKTKKLEEDIFIKNELLSNLLDNIPDNIYFKDKKSRFIAVSKALAKWVKAKSPEEMIGKTDFDYFTKEHAEPAFKDEQKVMRTGKPIIGKIEKETHLDGRVTWVSTTKIPRYDKEGNIIGTLGISRDVTEEVKMREKLRESEERNKAILSALPDLLFQVKKDGTFLSYFAPNEELLYAKPRDFLNKKIKDLLPEKIASLAMKGIKEVLKKGKVFRFEYELPLKGVLKNWEARIAKCSEESVIILVRDVTEIKEAEKEVAKLTDLIRQSSDGIFRMNKEMRIDYMNEAAKSLFGYSFSELKDKTLEVLIAEPEAMEIQKEIFDFVSKGRIYSKDHLSIKKDGSIFFARFRIIPLFEVNGEIYGYMASIIDISEEKKAQEELFFRKNLLDSLLENIPDEIFFKDRDSRFLEVSVSKAKKLGVSKEEIIGKTDFSFFEEEVAEKYFREEQEMMRNKQPIFGGIGKRIDENGKVHWISYSKVPRYDEEGNVIGLIGICRDITELKEKEEELRKEHELLSNTLESMEEGVLVLDKDFNFTYWNKEMERITGMKREEVLKSGKKPWELFPNLKDVKVDEMMREAMEGKVVKKTQIPYKRNDNKRIFTSEMYLPLRDPKGEIYGIIGVVRDITKEIEVEESLRESEEKYRILVESSKDGVFICRNGRFLFVNNRLSEILKYKKEELYAMEIWDVIIEEERDLIKEMGRRKEKGEEIPDVYEVNVITKDENIRLCELSLKKIKYQGEESFMGVLRDITEYRDMEREREKADRLESLGILAGGIAHDFNNFLTGILGNISLAKLHLSPDSEVYEILEESEKAAQSAKSLTQQLLTFSKGGVPVKGEVDIEDLVKSSANFVTSGSNVKCKFEFQKELWFVSGDKGQLNQVFNNIILNAIQAMPEGGIITIRGKNLELSKSSSLPLPSGKYVVVEVQDTGVGIPQNILPRIFDPFFTTKQKGSGLGLSTVFSIVKRHEGFVTVESEVGKGSTFYVYLPAKVKTKETLEEPEEKELQKGKGKVLIMDDKNFIRKSAVRALELGGYEVEDSSDGIETIRLYKKALNEGKPFDVVILDLTIPGGIGGEATLHRLKEIDPKVKAIVSSGYAEDPIMAEYKRYGFKAVVRKPYKYEELLEVVKKVIEEKS
ncbi:MAG: PAS domain S-box protein [candidate division WOR-3 bacterium]